MDIIDKKDRKNLFFIRIESIKQQGFDSYSKTGKDILDHYFEKYEELDLSLKASNRFTMLQWENLLANYNMGLQQVFELPPFEEYIAAFLFAFNGRYDLSLSVFTDCVRKLPSNLSGKINTVFINLQIAQLLERQGNYKRAFSQLLYTRKLIRTDIHLFSKVHSFYASCCVSIGLLCCRYFSYHNIATSCFITSILIRYKYKNTYSYDVFLNYISYAYRYIGMVGSLSHKDGYIYLKSSFEFRKLLIQNSPDNVSNEEMLHLHSDYLTFLIRNHYKIDTINYYSKSLYVLISNLPPIVRANLGYYIVNVSNILYKYYSLIKQAERATLWNQIMNHYNALMLST